MSPVLPGTSLRQRMPTYIARVLVLVGVFSFFDSFFGGNAFFDVINMITDLVPVLSGPSLFAAVVLLALAGPVRRRFKAANTVLIVVASLHVLLSALWLLAPDPTGDPIATIWTDLAIDVCSLLANIVGLALVIWARPAFTVRLASRAPLRALGVLATGLAVSLLLAYSLISSTVGGWERLRWAVVIAAGNPTGNELTVVPLWVVIMCEIIAAAAVVGCLLVLWRSERRSARLSAGDELELRALIDEFGENDSLSYFATRRDKDVVFSPDRRAAVSFRAQANVAIASGDPLGDRAAWPAAVSAWLQHTRRQGRFAAVVSASSAAAHIYVRHGLRALALGDEAVIETEDFSLSGRDMRGVQQAVRRVERAGYTAQIARHRDLSPAEMAEVTRLAESWRPEDEERGFSMALGRLGDPADGGCVVALARDESGKIRALLSFVPWGRRGLSLDLMRRSPSAVNGTTEFLITYLIRASEQLGVRRISLNFAVFRRAFSAADEVGAGPVVRATSAVLRFASRFYQLESLYRSNDKYHPTWMPRLLCYDPGLSVARAGLAMAQAEGFLPSAGSGSARKIQTAARDAAFAAAVAQQEERLRAQAPPEMKLGDQQRVRQAKAVAMTAAGRPAHAPAVRRDHTLAQARQILTGLSLPPAARTGQVVSLTGRVRVRRDLGGVSFAVLEEAGERLQIMTERAVTPAEQMRAWRKYVDLGDLVGVTGELVMSRSGEPSVALHSWTMAAKCLNPMPVLGATLAESARTRQRVLDLLTSPRSLDYLHRRALGVQALRQALVGRDFLEVETPMLQPLHGGAAARPFVTHSNAYNVPLYLRIAPELYLKRLAVAGMGRIFEVGRNFRNEGADATHNPEFTACEVYQAWTDYDGMRELAQDLIVSMARAINGRPVALRPRPDGTFEEVDLSGPWPVISIHAAVSAAVGQELGPQTGADQVRAVCNSHDVGVPEGASAGQMIMELYGALVEKQTDFPTFYYDFPAESSPLARPHRATAGLNEQWDLVAFGTELGCAYSELTDPVEQRRRLAAQSLAAAAGDTEAMSLDEDFVSALRYGMAPTGGLGLGVDRIAMTLLGQSIRATLAFPFVRPT